MSKKAKILIFDLEVSTSRVEMETYGLKVYTKYLNHKDVTRAYALHGAAWKWLGDEFTKCISVSPKAPFNDEGIVRELYKYIDEADIIVGHNMDAFDLKSFNTRAMYYGLPPVGKKVTVDTLKLAKKYGRFESNTLEFLLKFFKLGVLKEYSPNWQKIREGCPDELSYMRFYCKRDVEGAERLYLKLRTYDHNHPNIAAMQDVRDVAGKPVQACTHCGSTNVVKNGTFKTRAGISRPRFRCKDCGASFVSKKMKVTYEQV